MAGMWAGRRAIVTGASSGIGLEIARALAGEGAHLVLPVRSRERGDAARRSILRTHPGARIEIRDLDLARLDSVATFVDDARGRGEPIDLFVMNAGVVLLGDPQRHVTDDGFEVHFQTNFLAHFALTQALLPLLRDNRTRIAVQLSLAAARARVSDVQSENRYRPLRAYAASKLALGRFGVALARRSAAEGSGVRVNLCHPGVVPATGIAADLRSVSPSRTGRIVERIGNTPSQGAEPALMALASDAAPGRLFAPSGLLGISGPPRERRLFASLADADDGERTWAMADRMLRGAPSTR